MRLVVVSLSLLVALSPALVLTGCPPLPAPDWCTPSITRCSPRGLPETCSPGQRWTALPLALPCAQVGGVCCLVHGRSRDLYACAAPSACLADLSDAGGGAQ